MPKYTEVESLLKTAKKLSEGVFSTPLIIAAIENAPTADVVEVVRCKECKSYRICMQKGCCSLHLSYVQENDFCSYGERKEGAN